MKKPIRNRRIDTIFVLIIFSVFALSVLMVLTFGASIYKNISNIARDGQNERTVLSYVRSKIKNYDGMDRIVAGDFHGLSALYVYEELGHTLYNTIVYQYDGWLYEIFTEADFEFMPEDGIKITKVNDLSFKPLKDGLIQVTTGDLNLLISPRGGTFTTEAHFND